MLNIGWQVKIEIILKIYKMKQSYHLRKPRFALTRGNGDIEGPVE